MPISKRGFYINSNRYYFEPFSNIDDIAILASLVYLGIELVDCLHSNRREKLSFLQEKYTELMFKFQNGGKYVLQIALPRWLKVAFQVYGACKWQTAATTKTLCFVIGVRCV